MIDLKFFFFCCIITTPFLSVFSKILIVLEKKIVFSILILAFKEPKINILNTIYFILKSVFFSTPSAISLQRSGSKFFGPVPYIYGNFFCNSDDIIFSGIFVILPSSIFTLRLNLVLSGVLAQFLYSIKSSCIFSFKPKSSCSLILKLASPTTKRATPILHALAIATRELTTRPEAPPGLGLSP